MTAHRIIRETAAEGWECSCGCGEVGPYRNGSSYATIFADLHLRDNGAGFNVFSAVTRKHRFVRVHP